ncbi:MAG: TonB-dependent receptor plug domain-containing protein, partial [Phycisphaerales bacterium]|nr:TonB-dependent receptor plug domain-containing protein [Phycisphaerales bacterium]
MAHIPEASTRDISATPRRLIAAGLWSGLLLFVPGVVFAAPDEPAQEAAAEPVVEDPGALDDLDESVGLMFEDFDVVVTAGRTAQPINMTAVPVSVLTAKDIHLSGVATVPELFDFVPGMDALRIDRNLWSIGVRGLHQEFSDRTLLLVNGRTESSAFHGGIDFQLTPLFIEDIER